MPKHLSEIDQNSKQIDRFEKTLLHPATKEYLERIGFSYSYEVQAPKFGRCDFLIKPKPNFVIVADCKMKLSWHSVGQILGYKEQFQADEAWIITPTVDFENVYESHIFDLCKSLQIIVVNVSLSLAFEEEQSKGHRRIYHNQLNKVMVSFSVPKKEAGEIRKKILRIMDDRNYDGIETDFDQAKEIYRQSLLR